MSSKNLTSSNNAANQINLNYSIDSTEVESLLGKTFEIRRQPLQCICVVPIYCNELKLLGSNIVSISPGTLTRSRHRGTRRSRHRSTKIWDPGGPPDPPGLVEVDTREVDTRMYYSTLKIGGNFTGWVGGRGTLTLWRYKPKYPEEAWRDLQ